MLPFLDSKKMVSAISAKRGKPDIKLAPEIEAPGHEMEPGLKAAAEDILRAIESKSAIDLGKAFKAAFQVLESMPHEEGQE